MVYRFPLGTRNAVADARWNRADAGTGAGVLRIYSGTQPLAGAAPATTDVLLAEVVLQKPAFAAAANGAKPLNDPAPVNAVAGGTAGWFRILDSAGVIVGDGNVGTTDADNLKLGTTSFTTGLQIDLSGGSITEPSGD